MTMYILEEIEKQCVLYEGSYYYDPIKLTKKEQKEIMQEYRENEEKEKRRKPVMVSWDYLKIDFLVDEQKYLQYIKEKNNE